MTIVIEYIHTGTSNILGTSTYDDFEEVLIPDFVLAKHDVYIRKIFTSLPTTDLWKIEDLTVAGLKVTITVSPQLGSTSLGKTALSQGQSVRAYLDADKHQIVEVEFGIQQDVMTPRGRQGKNTQNSSALFPGDLYKKRPCILLDRSGDRVKVIPLTSDGSRKDPKQMLINPIAFNGLSKRYTEYPDGRPKDSYALVDIIQTVSTFRVHPMRLYNGSFANDYNRYHLAKTDIDDLKDKLVKLYANDVLKKNTGLTQRITKSDKERKTLITKRAELNAKLSDKELYIAKLEEGLQKLAEFEELKYSGIDDLLDEIEKLHTQ
ncbi:hypothetical protein GNP73_08095 [Aliivibrio fischeri]|uniref:hypothetical protein n=1 Tax=Aliivibrio fischeri TaxID=668 RepID=UPI00141494CD|nr:hypothetical protein [Aliivibrio fischeri]MUJ27937.1 hypothetical protein [Aliivibrio fischeri]